MRNGAKLKFNLPENIRQVINRVIPRISFIKRCAGFFMNVKTGGSFVLQIIKGAAVALVCTLVGILLFALVLKMAALSTTAVKAVNQFIKVISLFLGCFTSVRGKGGWLKGLLTGILYISLTHLAFLIMCGSGAGGSFWADLVFGAVAGAICGILAVNAKSARTE